MGLRQRVPKTQEQTSACFIYTPRAEHMMPVIRRATVAVHVPLIPSDSRAESVAHLWWEAKHAHDTVRHR